MGSFLADLHYCLLLLSRHHCQVNAIIQLDTIVKLRLHLSLSMNILSLPFSLA